MFTSSTPEQNQRVSLPPRPRPLHASEGGVRTRDLAHERAHSLGAALAGHRNLEFVLRNKINQKPPFNQSFQQQSGWVPQSKGVQRGLCERAYGGGRHDLSGCSVDVLICFAYGQNGPERIFEGCAVRQVVGEFGRVSCGVCVPAGGTVEQGKK